ncbi:MAG: DUF6624 domain-containing protein [Bacteroidota bacterium]
MITFIKNQEQLATTTRNNQENVRIQWLLFFLLISLVACEKPPTTSPLLAGLSKLSDQELIDRARMANFPDINTVTYLSTDGQVISRDSFTRLANLEDLAFDDYADASGVVKVTVLRPATAADKILTAKINQAYAAGPPVPSVSVDCNEVNFVLDTILTADQAIRKQEVDFDRVIDARNIATVLAIIENCGMPTENRQLEIVWLVIQHAGSKFQKKYVGAFEAAVQTAKFDLRNVLMMKDRILMSEGRPQVYGTQLSGDGKGGYKLYDTVEPELLNQRRKAVGFQPIEDYLLRWGVLFDIPQREK